MTRSSILDPRSSFSWPIQVLGQDEREPEVEVRSLRPGRSAVIGDKRLAKYRPGGVQSHERRLPPAAGERRGSRNLQPVKEHLNLLLLHPRLNQGPRHAS